MMPKAVLAGCSLPGACPPSHVFADWHCKFSTSIAVASTSVVVQNVLELVNLLGHITEVILGLVTLGIRTYCT